jgi:hypothetical protein
MALEIYRGLLYYFAKKKVAKKQIVILSIAKNLIKATGGEMKGV